jgi:cytochrome c-type biogenesis protein CcmE
MKLSQVLIIVIVAVAIGIIFSTLTDAGTYDVFNTAFKNPGNEYHIVGKFNQEKESNYNPSKDPNLFSFYMADSTGTEKCVLLHKEKPADFEHAERVVVIGKAKGDTFHARDILMKCPSKYNNAQAKDPTTSLR